MNYNNNNGGEGNHCCYFHPREAVVGVCALCLKERLIILAAKQGQVHHLRETNKNNQKPFRILQRKPSIKLPKLFALGSFLHLLEFKNQRSPVNYDTDEKSIPSLEDSFISIKFSDNGQALWDGKTNATATAAAAAAADDLRKPLPNTTSSLKQVPKEDRVTAKSMIEHVKPRNVLRWRTRIGHLFHMSRWKMSSKAGTCHVNLPSKLDVQHKGSSNFNTDSRRGWIRSLTKRRAATV